MNFELSLFGSGRPCLCLLTLLYYSAVPGFSLLVRLLDLLFDLFLGVVPLVVLGIDLGEQVRPLRGRGLVVGWVRISGCGLLAWLILFSLNHFTLGWHLLL